MFIVEFRNRIIVGARWLWNWLLHARDTRLITGSSDMEINAYSFARTRRSGYVEFRLLTEAETISPGLGALPGPHISRRPLPAGSSRDSVLVSTRQGPPARSGRVLRWSGGGAA